MTEQEKIELIVKTLTKSTIDNAIEWKLKDTIFNSEKRYDYQYISVDGKTKFEIEVSLSDDLSCVSKWSGALFIYNENLIEGRKLVSSNLSYDLRVSIYNKYIKQNIIIKQESDTLDNILNNISDKHYMRDVKLDTLLDDKETEGDKPIGILSKIFGK